MYKSQRTACRLDINEVCNFNKLHRRPADAIFVHTEIFDEFDEVIIKRKKQIFDGGNWNFDLMIDGTEVPMKLIWWPKTNEDDYMEGVLIMAQYSYPWRRNATIYVPVQQFVVIKNFIQHNHLERCVERISTDRSRLFIDEDIKVVEFQSTVPADTIGNFKAFIAATKYEPPINRFIKYAFSYFRPDFLKFYDKPYYNPDTITQVLLILDYHRFNRRKGVEIFNIFDLIAMKMAIDDNRLDYENCEFHKLINKTLREMADRGEYFKGKTFNLIEYRSDRMIFTNPSEIYEYLIYNFNSQFDRVNKYTGQQYKLKLSNHLWDNKIYTILKSSNITLEVEGQFLDESSATRILKFLLSDGEHSSVTLNFDTDHPWCYDCDDSDEKSGYVYSIYREYRLNFMGSNSKYFIENFFNWVKFRLGPIKKYINVSFLAAPIFYPYIFHDTYLNDISLHDIELNSKLICALAHSKCQRLMLFDCTLSNDYTIFQSLDKLKDIWHSIRIRHFDYFFDMLMQYLETNFASGNISEIQLKHRLEYERVALNSFKFTLNEERTKIESTYLYANTIVNIFDYFYDENLFTTNRDDFEFYQ